LPCRPAATRIYTPQAYRDDLGPKHTRYKGYHELAYLHPNRFTPDQERLATQGLAPGEPYTFIRLVSWQSHHDIGDYGVRDIHRVVERLGKYGRVLVSSEAPLPPDLQAFAYTGAVADVHHFLAFARLTFGESATMASESAMLGVPGVFISTSSRGYTDEQESRYGLVFNFNGERAREELALQRAEEILVDSQSAQLFADRRAAMLTDSVDVTDLIVTSVEEYALRR
jgi:predicted glycosyltransferase